MAVRYTELSQNALSQFQENKHCKLPVSKFNLVIELSHTVGKERKPKLFEINYQEVRT